MKPINVRCPKCGEMGSEKRMDIRLGRCYYCRIEDIIDEEKV